MLHSVPSVLSGQAVQQLGVCIAKWTTLGVYCCGGESTELTCSGISCSAWQSNSLHQERDTVRLGVHTEGVPEGALAAASKPGWGISSWCTVREARLGHYLCQLEKPLFN